MSRQTLTKDLSLHYRSLRRHTIADLFARSPQRFEKFSLFCDDLFLDYSRNLITEETLDLLYQLLASTHFEARRHALLTGREIEGSNIPATMHTVLRHPAPDTLGLDNGDLILSSRNAFLDFAERVRTGKVVSASGEKFRDVVNLGIGGGHIGVALACRALSTESDTAPQVHCLASSNEVGLRNLLKTLNPKTTLFIISSRSFQTSETLFAAHRARDWVRAGGMDHRWHEHFVAATVNLSQAMAFGLSKSQCYEIPQGVAGRLSLWSATGLALAIHIGRDRFTRMLDGAAVMDEHFATAPTSENMPIILALLGFWYSDIGQYGSHAILTYENALDLLPSYLQQLHMESNGKSVSHLGQAIEHSSPVVWGGVGLEGQHAYYQMLHQGTWPVFCEFIMTAQSQLDSAEADFARANCIAQARALMEGSSHDDPNKRLIGSKPSNTLLLKCLNPRTFGMLIALYEHKVFTQSVLWGTNMFDQWGVELGKRLADELLPALRDGNTRSNIDATTAGIVKQVNRWRD